MLCHGARKLLLLTLFVALVPGLAPGQIDETPPAEAALMARLERAGDRREEWETALREIDSAQRPALVFLLQHMPEADLRQLTADYVTEHIRLAYAARARVPWGASIPEQEFLNDVLPYAHVDETRERWRQRMFEIAFPLVQDCQAPAEAAQVLNEKLFGIVAVKYSTARRKANQAPGESIEQGLASCTGLSILLADACRSVCVPARLAGIPSWPNKRGNHTWVEVWDQGWHFTGAAEPDARGLNHTWFQGDAALAEKDSRLHAIYAVSFAETGTTFPTVWSRNREWPIHAVNVTDRYAQPKPAMPSGKVQAMIRVWNAGRTERIVTEVRLLEGNDVATGKSRGPQADMNDLLSFPVEPNRPYELELKMGEQVVRRTIEVGSDPNQLFEIEWNDLPEPATPSVELSDAEQAALRAFFATAEGEPLPPLPDSLQARYLAERDAVREAIWTLYQDSDAARAMRSDYEQNQVQFGEHLSPYTVKEVGTRPESGWPLFIAMHGGGGAPARVNDSQWRHMQIYYHDHPELGGYKYLALRAPNNTWNGFYDDYVYPLIENLIVQMVIHGDVDPQKVFAMGYSHGGYGAFAIGPKIPYRFAAVHSSAAAPTDGQTSARTLRNLRFTFMVGEKDDAYGRRERCQKFAALIEQLKEKNPGEYPVEFLFQPGYGHGGLPDRDMITQMYEYEREPAPLRVTWEMTDEVVDEFYWLSCSQPVRGQTLDARWEDNRLHLSADPRSRFTVWFDERLIARPDQPVNVELNGTPQPKIEYVPNVANWCESLRRRRDPLLAFDGRVDLEVPASPPADGSSTEGK